MQKLVFSLSIITIGLVIGYISQRLALAGKIKADASLAKQRKILQRVVLLCLNPIATIGAIWILSFDNVRITLMPAIGILAMITGGLAALVRTETKATRSLSQLWGNVQRRVDRSASGICLLGRSCLCTGSHVQVV